MLLPRAAIATRQPFAVSAPQARPPAPPLLGNQSPPFCEQPNTVISPCLLVPPRVWIVKSISTMTTRDLLSGPITLSAAKMEKHQRYACFTVYSAETRVLQSH